MTFQFPKEKHIISSLFLWRTYQSCQQLGARRPVLLKAMELQEADLRDPLRCFSTRKFSELLRAAAVELKSGPLTAEIACQMVPKGFSDPSYLAMFQPNFESVLQWAAGAQRLAMEKPVLRLERHKFSDHLVWDEKICQSRELMGLVFAVIIQSIGPFLQKGNPAIRKICFANAKPSDWVDWHLENVTDCDLDYCFDQSRNRIEFHRGFFDLPNPNQNMAIIELSNAQRDHLKWQNRPYAKLCYDYLVYLLDKSGLNLDSAAETLEMAERTLRRKLVAEDTSFREILGLVRRDICQLYFLEGKRQLSEISTLLGYSELSAFTRAYTSWYGHPPSRDSSGYMRRAA